MHLNLFLEKRRCLVIGGGKVAFHKTELLLEANAIVHIISPDLSPELQRLLDLNLGVLRPAIKGRIGFFFVKKKSGMLRMVLDLRDVNQYHLRAPHTRLGTPAALADLDLSTDTLRRHAEEGAHIDPHIATFDLTD